MRMIIMKSDVVLTNNPVRLECIFQWDIIITLPPLNDKVQKVYIPIST